MAISSKAAPQPSIDPGETGSDNCVGTAAKVNCEGIAPAVTLRDASKASVGETSAPGAWLDPGLRGRQPGAADTLNVTYTGSGDVQLALSGGSFDTAATDAGGCARPRSPLRPAALSPACSMRSCSLGWAATTRSSFPSSRRGRRGRARRRWRRPSTWSAATAKTPWSTGRRRICRICSKPVPATMRSPTMVAPICSTERKRSLPSPPSRTSAPLLWVSASSPAPAARRSRKLPGPSTRSLRRRRR